MPPDSPFLLVIDPNPESAARVNSLLRNSGISVHVLHADNVQEAERLVGEFSPFLIYFLPASQERFPVEQAARLAEARKTFLGIALGNGGQALFEQASGSAPCIGIGDEAQLPAIARRLVGLGRAHQEQERLKAQEAELEDRLHLLMNSTREPIAYFHEGLHVAANAAYLELLEVPSFDDLAMVSLLEILEREDTDLKAMVRGFGRQEFPADRETFRLRPPGKAPLDVQLSFAPVRYEGEDCVQMVVRREADAHGGERPQELPTAPPEAPHQEAPAPEEVPEPQARESADTPAPAENQPETEAPVPPPGAGAPDSAIDPLTGMAWRAPFLKRLNDRLHHLPDDRRAAVYFLANDNANEQLDELGVAELDRYVRFTADEVLSCLEDDDEVCRFNDSSFALFALRPDKSDLKRLGERLCAGIARMAQDRPDAPVPATCSVGLVLLDQQHHDAEHTLEKARSACRIAAEEGNRVMRYKPARVAGVSEDEEAHWRERIRYALESEDFYTVQHSIQNLDGGLEGLVENRTFMHEDDGDLPAAAYLPAAERNQLASQIDRMVIPGLLRAVAGGEERQIIDISGNSVQDFSFPTWFQRTLQESRVPGQRIVLQWPAWSARQQTKAATRLIEELSPLGVKFSVSGFDADGKTLELLQKLNLQFITLDRELTTDLEGDPTRLDAIREIIRAAGDLQVLTIASDVSTSGDLAMLWRGGVKLVSGDFIQETPRVIGQ